MEQLIDAASNNWFWTVIGGIAIFSIVFSAVKSMVKNSHRERSRREIAAYIAEGSMSAEQGERLMKARPSAEEC